MLKEGVINIGCGKRKIKHALNIDLDLSSEADVIMDMSKLPWQFADSSLNEIHMYHFLEHMKEPENILKECWRVLKPEGKLIITVPHSMSAVGNGCLVHYRTYSYNSLKDYLTKKQYFKTTHQRIVWLPHFEWLPIQWLIDLCPIFFERFWGYWVGGATEVQWQGKKY